MFFPITQLSALPQRLLACSGHSSLWVQSPGQFIPHLQDKTGWHYCTNFSTNFSQTFCSKQDQTAVNLTRCLTLSPNSLFCVCSQQRAQSAKLMQTDMRSEAVVALIQVPQSGLYPSQFILFSPFSSAISSLTSFITCCTSPPEHLVLNPQIPSILCP